MKRFDDDNALFLWENLKHDQIGLFVDFGQYSTWQDTSTKSKPSDACEKRHCCSGTAKSDTCGLRQ